jgi:hypothetical protein
MGWLPRLFGHDKPADAQVNPEAAPAPGGETIPPERVGLNGEYDQSGLAKRVALAFDQDARFEAIETVYIAQTGGTVVLKGTVPSQDILNQLVLVANGVNGATDVTTAEVKVG